MLLLFACTCACVRPPQVIANVGMVPSKERLPFVHTWINRPRSGARTTRSRSTTSCSKPSCTAAQTRRVRRSTRRVRCFRRPLARCMFPLFLCSCFHFFHPPATSARSLAISSRKGTFGCRHSIVATRSTRRRSKSELEIVSILCHQGRLCQ